ncbi:hypothetical protein PG988_011760 [Apiospora saccharicola]
MFLGCWLRRGLLSSEWGRRAAGASRFFADEEIAAAKARAARLSPEGQAAAARRHIAFCDAAVSASAAAHEFARRAPAGSAEAWLAQGHLRAAQGWCVVAFAEEEEAGPASEKALAAAANCAAAVKGEGVEGGRPGFPSGPERCRQDRRSSFS